MRNHTGCFLLILLVLGCGLTAIARFLYMVNNPPFRQVADFSSPDGQWSCVIREQDPPGLLMQSPYSHRFELMHNGNMTPGQPIEFGTDSTTLSDYQVTWEPNRVVVHAEPNRIKAVCEFPDGRQNWHWDEPTTSP